MSAYDVVVVGARPAGAATAMLLAREGLSVLVVDRGRYGADTLSTHALMRAGVVQLSRWGLLDRVIDLGTPPARRVTFRYGDAVVPVEVRPSHGVDALYAPRRTVLDPILVDAARSAGAKVRFGTTVTGVLRDLRGTVTGISARDRAGSTFTVDARMVIGADGINSTIGDAVGARYERVGTSTAAVTYGYFADLPVDGYESNWRALASSGAIPTNDGLTCVFASSSRSGIGRGGLEPLTRIVASSSPDLAARLSTATPVGLFRTFNGRPGHIRRSWGPGWALVGDAGLYRDPLIAYGLTAALRDADLLARAVLAGGLPSLRDYQATRDRLSTPLFEIADVLASHRWTDVEVADLLLDLNTALVADLDNLTTA